MVVLVPRDAPWPQHHQPGQHGRRERHQYRRDDLPQMAGDRLGGPVPVPVPVAVPVALRAPMAVSAALAVGVPEALVVAGPVAMSGRMAGPGGTAGFGCGDGGVVCGSPPDHRKNGRAGCSVRAVCR